MVKLFARRAKINSKHVRLVVDVLFFALLFIVTFVCIGIHASKDLEVNRYTIETKITKPLKIVQISDLHNAQFGFDNEDLTKIIIAQHPDLIFMTGDMINCDDPHSDTILTLIRQLASVAPIYYGYGNHEVSWIDSFGEGLSEQLTEAGAIIVQDSYVDIDVEDNSLRIGGCMNYYRKWGMMTDSQDVCDMEEAFANDFENTNRYKILLNHIPTSFTDWEGMNKYRVDLVFSGHYHGGMARIPVIDRGVYAPYIGLFPKYTKGVFYGEKAVCVQSAGLGTEYSVPRIFNPPEIVVVDLVPLRD